MSISKKILYLVIILLIIITSVYFLTNTKKKSGQQEDVSVIPSPNSVSPSVTQAIQTGYSGSVLAGSSSVLLDFNQQDYELARQSDKLVVLYFYANWCPICREEIPKLYAAFDQLDSENVVGFRVNFNDNETDDAERNLARQFGVAYQHSKVFIKNGERLLKSPEPWELSRYQSEIERHLGD